MLPNLISFVSEGNLYIRGPFGLARAWEEDNDDGSGSWQVYPADATPNNASYYRTSLYAPFQTDNEEAAVRCIVLGEL